MDPRPMTQSDRRDTQCVVHWEFPHRQRHPRRETPVQAALAKLAQAIGGTELHVNAGQSEDYQRGFHDGAEDAEEARAAQPGDGDLPADDPRQRAYRRGYQAGWDWMWNESMD